MAFSAGLQHQIDLCILAVNSDPQGHLRPYDRDQIYNFFTPFAQVRRVHASAWLAFLAAKYVLAILEKVFIPDKVPQELQPRYMLQIAEEVLQGQRDSEDKIFEREVNLIHSASGNSWGFDDDDLPFNAYLVGISISETFSLVGIFPTDPFMALRCDKSNEPGNKKIIGQVLCLDENLKDDAIDDGYLGSLAGIMDTAGLAARAYAWVRQRPDWSSEYSIEKRRRFWLWWLTEAIPIAWEQANKHR
jgi:hypothetical protein